MASLSPRRGPRQEPPWRPCRCPRAPAPPSRGRPQAQPPPAAPIPSPSETIPPLTSPIPRPGRRPRTRCHGGRCRHPRSPPPEAAVCSAPATARPPWRRPAANRVAPPTTSPPSCSPAPRHGRRPHRPSPTTGNLRRPLALSLPGGRGVARRGCPVAGIRPWPASRRWPAAPEHLRAFEPTDRSIDRSGASSKRILRFTLSSSESVFSENKRPAQPLQQRTANRRARVG